MGEDSRDENQDDEGGNSTDSSAEGSDGWSFENEDADRTASDGASDEETTPTNWRTDQQDLGTEPDDERNWDPETTGGDTTDTANGASTGTDPTAETPTEQDGRGWDTGASNQQRQSRQQSSSARTSDWGGTQPAGQQSPTGGQTVGGQQAHAAGGQQHPGERSTIYCRECGEQISASAEICPNCGVRQRNPPSSEKDPGIAVLLSFFLAGAGQLYNGEVGKGIVLAAAEIILITLILLTVWFLVGLIFVPIWLAVWGYAMYDAYQTAEAINRGEYRP